MRSLRRAPDLVAGILYSLLAAAALLALSEVSGWTGVRIAVGAPFLFVVPGYLALQALFPDDASGGPVDGLETLAFAVGLSIALVTLVGLFLGIGVFTKTAIVVSLVAINACTGGLAWWRRSNPRQQRWVPRPSPRRWPRVGEVALLGVLVLAVAWLFVLATGIWAPAATTEYGLVDTTADEGEFARLPTNLSVGESVSVGVEISNHEARTRSYVVTVTQEVFVNGSVVETRSVGRLETTVPSDGTVTVPLTLIPTIPGRSRFVFRIRPSDGTRSAGAQLHLWTTVLKKNTGRPTDFHVGPPTGSP